MKLEIENWEFGMENRRPNGDRVRGAGFWEQGTEYRVQNTEFRVQSPLHITAVIYETLH